jgi:threonine aldolase
MSQHPIDLRSDTVTRPTAEMRRAMAEAEVGDDVYGEDPTANRLERRAAEIFGKEAALLVPTGVMGNTIAIKLHTNHGQEVICDTKAHILNYELSMVGWFSGCVCRTIPTDDGILQWSRIRPEVRVPHLFNGGTGVINIENTHNLFGGTVYPQETIDEICDEAHAMGIEVHMDGARVFNASTATGVPVDRIAKKVDTLMFCMSKGLGAPMGSILVGSADAIARGRIHRKRLGGGMRQSGIIAAAGLVAIEKMAGRLQEDHDNAQFMAAGLREIEGIRVKPVPTNVVVFDVSGTGVVPADFSTRLKERGVLINTIDTGELRLVTHMDVNREACQRALDVVGEIAAG